MTETMDGFDLSGVSAQIFNMDAAYRDQLTTEVDYGQGPRLPINRKHLKKFLEFPTSVAGTYNTGDVDPSRFFFASDHHFGHKNIIKYTNRPFESVMEMNEEMVRRHNEVVGVDDFCLFGGDIGFAPANKTNQWLARMNGTKIFVLGNHDFERDGSVKRYAVDCEQLWWRVPGTQEEFQLVFTHYPLDNLPEWIVNIHGHTHDKVSDNPQHINLCVEHHDYTPVHMDRVLEIARMRYIEMQG